MHLCMYAERFCTGDKFFVYLIILGQTKYSNQFNSPQYPSGFDNTVQRALYMEPTDFYQPLSTETNLLASYLLILASFNY